MIGMTHVLDPDALPRRRARVDGAAAAVRRRHPLRLGVPRLPARPAGRRPGRRRGPRRRAGHPVDQDHGEGLGDRHRHLDGRPHHARGRRHPRQGPQPRREGPPPDPGDPSCPQVAAVCVYGDLAGVAREALAGHRHPRRRRRHRLPQRPRQPRGQARRRARTPWRTAPTRSTWSSTAAPSWPAATSTSTRRSSRSRRPAGTPHLKVILETGELVTLDNVRRASWLAMLAGGDFIKTSTGKISPAATLPVCLVMLEAVRDFRAATGRQIGVKPAGGIRTTKDADQAPRPGQRDRRAPTGSTPTGSASAPPACSTTSCCSGRSSAPATTPAPTTSAWTEPR